MAGKVTCPHCGADNLITGKTSDGYHTFDELYHHRAVLFSVIVRNYQELCWKSKKHNDGSMYDGMFIVGINTPDGAATYHYDVEPYWDMFDCAELEKAPEWDGHKPERALKRIGKLKRMEPVNRVLTLEELKNMDTDGDGFQHVWIEHVFGEMHASLMRNKDERYAEVIDCDCERVHEYQAAYGRSWRCWLRKPTNDECDNIPWEKWPS